MVLAQLADVSDHVVDLLRAQAALGRHLPNAVGDVLLELGVGLRLHLFRAQRKDFRVHHFGQGLVALAVHPMTALTRLLVNFLALLGVARRRCPGQAGRSQNERGRVQPVDSHVNLPFPYSSRWYASAPGWLIRESSFGKKAHEYPSFRTVADFPGGWMMGLLFGASVLVR